MESSGCSRCMRAVSIVVQLVRVGDGMLSDRFDASGQRQRRCHVPRHQFIDAVDRMISDAFEHVGKICLGIEAVQARRADQAIHRGCAFAT